MDSNLYPHFHKKVNRRCRMVAPSRGVTQKAPIQPSVWIPSSTTSRSAPNHIQYCVRLKSQSETTVITRFLDEYYQMNSGNRCGITQQTASSAIYMNPSSKLYLFSGVLRVTDQAILE
jgi:hypothetical protein